MPYSLAQKSSPISPVNITAEGVAIKGYDPVAYFTDMKPIRGISEFKYSWKNAQWRFAGSDHLEMFTKNPEKYAQVRGLLRLCSKPGENS